ncbi:MAG TPA: hypothetical protein PKC43_06255 [Phycisphaerales bacterium]|nr:hypothetical protein [Phycisphaerales bacterium]HMP37034.1 hypothetical protein [Phycisphaerales bacterium]
MLQFASAGDALQKMSARTGASAEALSELGVAAQLSGTSVEVMEKGIRTMQRTIAEAANGSAMAADSLALLGLSAAKLAGMSPDRQLEAIADGLAAITDDAQRTAAAMRVFGRSGAELIPMLSGGSAGIAAMRKQAHDLGLTVSTETANSAARLNDALFLLFATVKKVSFEIGAALAPAVERFAKVAAPIVASVIRWVKANQQIVVAVAKVTLVVLAAGIAITALGIAIVGLGAVLGAAATIVAALGAALAAMVSPIGLLIIGLAGLVTWLLRFTSVGVQAVEWIKGRFASLLPAVNAVWTGIRDALAAGDLGLAMEVAWAAVKLAWTAGIGYLEERWTQFRGWITTAVMETWAGIQLFGASVWHAFEIAAVEAMAMIRSAWAQTVAAMAKAARPLVELTTEILARTGDLVGAGDTFRMGGAAIAATLPTGDQIDTQLDEDRALIEARRQLGRGVADATLSGRQNVIGNRLVEGDAERRVARDATIAKNAKALADAQAKLQEAIAAAGAARKQSDDDANEREKRIKRATDDGLEIGGQTSRAESRGTFSAAAARGLDSPNTVGPKLDRMLEFLRTIARNTESDGPVLQEGA